MSAKETWLTPYLEAWAEATGTVVQALPAARSAKVFKALETAFGAEVVQSRWRSAWATTSDMQKRFLTPESFARRFGEFRATPTDVFGFACYSDEQRDLASEIFAATSPEDKYLGLGKLRDRFQIPASFPESAVLLRAYESLRGYHERSASEFPTLKSDRPALDQLLSHMVGA